MSPSEVRIKVSGVGAEALVELALRRPSSTRRHASARTWNSDIVSGDRGETRREKEGENVRLRGSSLGSHEWCRRFQISCGGYLLGGQDGCELWVSVSTIARVELNEMRWNA
jgi:hypothetical protein